MADKPRYSATLLRFISSFEIAPNNFLILNTLDKEAEFVSRYFTPRLRVSELASYVLKDIQSEQILPMKTPPIEGSFLEAIEGTSMREDDNNLYQISKIILLEAFSIHYLLEHKREYTKYLNERDIQQARTNMKYLLDAIGRKDSYDVLRDHLYDFDISLGYIQGQIPVLRKEAPNG